MLPFRHFMMMIMLTLTVLLASLYPTIKSYETDKTASNIPEKEPSKTVNEDDTVVYNHHHIPFDCPQTKSESRNVQVCKKFSVQNSFLDFQHNCDTVLSFFIGNVSLEVCIRQSRLLLPNSSIIFVSHRTRTYPLHRTKLLSKIKSFFTGSVLVSQWISPFSGNIHSSKLSGRSVMFDKVFKLECNNYRELDHTIDHRCFQCQAFCSYPESEEGLINIEKEKIFNTPHEGLRMKQNHRKMRSKLKDFHKMTCSLHLVSDHLFFKFVGDKNVIKTSNIMIEVVNKVNAIFKKNFNRQNGLKELGFAIQRITIHSNDRSNNHKFNSAYMTSDEYLKEFSYTDFSSVCLGVGFTFRNFDSVVGTAFPAYTSSNIPGGICEERVKINSHHVSYNTAVLSFYNHKKPSIDFLALTLTHELGHSFGARHDETDECLPGEGIGNFIMSSIVNSGDKPNNYLFSNCSLRSILPVILRNKKCLYSAHPTPNCDNAILRDGEECDSEVLNQCEITDPC